MTITIGKNIQLFRKKLGFNQQQLGDLIGVPRELISYYENGNREVSLLHLEKIASCLNVDMEVLLSDEAETVKSDLAFAFRANELSPEDVKSIGIFKEIVHNFNKMKNIQDRGI